MHLEDRFLFLKDKISDMLKKEQVFFQMLYGGLRDKHIRLLGNTRWNVLGITGDKFEFLVALLQGFPARVLFYVNTRVALYPVLAPLQ